MISKKNIKEPSELFDYSDDLLEKISLKLSIGSSKIDIETFAAERSEFNTPLTVFNNGQFVQPGKDKSDNLMLSGYASNMSAEEKSEFEEEEESKRGSLKLTTGINTKLSN